MAIEMMYWHWIVVGIGLMLIEIILPSFTMLWFGAGAITVGLLLAVFPELSLTTQVVLWTALSVLYTTLWFKFVKPMSIDRTKAGLSRESIIGETGQVMVVPNTERRGLLRFPAPILGSDEWQFICEEALVIGDRVVVVDLSGNSLIVSKT
ncbi:MAG: hypothetical protein ACI9GW_000181 [Halieaceae bacterium]|jgi:membrane protein implicated in regulation of membrane protease activity